MSDIEPSCPINLTRNMTILQRGAAKLDHFVRQAKETDADTPQQRKTGSTKLPV